MKLVLFLGAGFSAQFGLPVMNDFLSFVHTSKVVKEEDKAFLGRLVIEARQANSFLQSSPVNLEDLLTFAIMGDRLKLGPEADGNRGDRVRRLLQRVYTEVRSPGTFWTDFDDVTKFVNVDLSRREHELTIVTTNYDMMVECAFHHMGMRVNPCIPYRPIIENRRPETDAFYSASGPHLLKLHGSVNWYVPEDWPAGFEVESRMTTAQHSGQDGPKQVPLPKAVFAPEQDSRVPAVIPPSFLKPDMSGPLTDVWAKAAGALRSARRVVFVGYSFPPSDMEMKYFLARSLQDNPDLERIDIIDPNADAILARIKSETSGYGTHFRDFLKGTALRWVATKLDWS